MAKRQQATPAGAHPTTPVIRLLSFFISNLIRLILFTVRVHRNGPTFDQSGVIAFWHGEQLPLLAVRPDSRSVAPVSLSRDGTLQTHILRRFGITAVRGSSSRGGAAVLRTLLRELRQGRTLLIAVDGPRGPRHKAKQGAQYLAMKAGVPLWCISVFAPRSIRLRRAWDQFVIPLPFSSIYVCVDEPQYPKHNGIASLLESDIEKSLHRLAQSARNQAAENLNPSQTGK